MSNILYLDDYINFYNDKLKKIIIEKPYNNTLFNGKIINKDKFINKFVKIKEKYKINNNLFNENIIVIINSSFKDIDKLILKEILEELNYKKVKFVNEVDIIKLNKKSIFINYSISYFYIYNINHQGSISQNIYENNYVNKKLILNIIDILNKEDIIFTGKNYRELLNVLKTSNKNYYYYEENDNLLIKLFLKIKNV